MVLCVSFRVRPHIAESVPASGAGTPPTGICARALANPRQQGLPACRPHFNTHGNRAENSFRTALPAMSSRQVFPGMAKFSVIKKEHCRTCGSGKPTAKIMAKFPKI
jgi:hypothetical protein